LSNAKPAPAWPIATSPPWCSIQPAAGGAGAEAAAASGQHQRAQILPAPVFQQASQRAHGALVEGVVRFGTIEGDAPDRAVDLAQDHEDVSMDGVAFG